MAAAAAVVARMHEARVRLVTGTDAGVAPAKTFGVIDRAVDELFDITGDVLGALRSVTSTAADVLGLPAKGRLIRGADADVVVVGGNPFAEPGLLGQVRAVYQKGTRWNP